MLELLHHRKRPTTGASELGPEHGFRPNTPVLRYPVNFVMNDGGLGDYVNYAAATRWVAYNCPWIDGHLFLPNYLVPLMRDIHAEFSHWRVWPAEKVVEHLVEGASVVGPSIHQGGKNINPQLLSVIGAHPIDVGYAYYAGGAPAPRDLVMPILDYPREHLLPQVKRIKGKYAVFTTGGTTQARTVTGRHLNPLIEYAVRQGVTPVFIGKENFVGDGKNTVKYASDIKFELGVDMRNQTSVKDAACIMQHAAFTLGLDNGNLHLAALMRESRVIFGYNITTVEHRQPRRRHGKTINMALPQEALSCSGCQSRWRQFHTHAFDKCFYGDVACVDMLFLAGQGSWKNAIDEMLT